MRTYYYASNTWRNHPGLECVRYIVCSRPVDSDGGVFASTIRAESIREACDLLPGYNLSRQAERRIREALTATSLHRAAI